MTSGIIEILIKDAGVQAIPNLQRAGDDTYKVFPVVNLSKENDSQPYIVVFKTGNSPTQKKGVASELDYPVVQVNCYGKNFRQSETMFEAVRAALDNKQSTTDVGYEFSRIWLIDDRDGWDNDAECYVHVSTFGCELKR